MDRRRLRTAHYVEGDGLVGVATEAADLQISVTRVQGVADCRRRLGRSLVAEHPVIPDFKGEPVGHLARRLVDADKPPPAAFLDALFIAHADHSLDQNYCTRRRGAPTSIRAEAMTVLLKLAI